MGERFLIVNADDFGRGRGINAGVIKAHTGGILTSASLMVRWPAAAEAAEWGRSREGFSLGLHVDLGEWVYEGEEWVARYEVVPFEYAGAVRAEIDRQLETFRELVGADPTHLDSHQHVHKKEPAATVLRRLAVELDVPLRHSDHINYCGDLHGHDSTGEPIDDAISVERMLEILRDIPPGVTELACHPGEGDDIEPPYRDEREQELRVLCDSRVREAVTSNGIVLGSFADVPAGHRPS